MTLGRLCRRMPARLTGAVVLASVALAAAIAAPAASARLAATESTCSTAVGEATVGEKTEKQRLKNILHTNLSEPQRLNFSWEGGKQRFHMQLLVRAVCRVGRRGDTFSGRALGTLNKIAGYSMSFSIKITAEGETFLKAKIKHGTELIEEFEEQLEESTEEIS